MGSFFVLIKALKCFLKSSPKIEVEKRQQLLWLKKICQQGQQLSPQWQNRKTHRSAKPKPEQLQTQADLPRPAHWALISFYISFPAAFAGQPDSLPPAAQPQLLEAGLSDCPMAMQQQRCPGWCSGKPPCGCCAIRTTDLLGAPETSLACAFSSTVVYFGRVKKTWKG